MESLNFNVSRIPKVQNVKKTLVLFVLLKKISSDLCKKIISMSLTSKDLTQFTVFYETKTTTRYNQGCTVIVDILNRFILPSRNFDVCMEEEYPVGKIITGPGHKVSYGLSKQTHTFKYYDNPKNASKFINDKYKKYEYFHKNVKLSDIAKKMFKKYSL